MPSAFTLLFGIIAIMAVLTWILPAGKYDMTADETPIAGTYQTTDRSPQGIWDLFQAPIQGFIQAADVVVFVLVIGGFLAVQMKTGALDAGFGRLIRRLKGKEKWMIPILMTFFAIGGTTYGMQEETIAFYPLLIPLILAAGYNALTVVLVIVLGSGVGVLGSTVNPFSTGIASGFADVSIGDGIIPRLIILALSLLAAIWFVMRYAAKVKSGRIKESHSDIKLAGAAAHVSHAAEPPELTAKRKAILWVFGLTFVVMIIGVIPWAYKFDIMIFQNAVDWLADAPVLGTLLGNIVPPGDWWFSQLAALFLFSAIIIAMIDRMGESDFADTFIDGAKALMGVALIIAVARGVTVVMTDGAIAATIIHAGEEILNGMSQGVFSALSFIVYIPLSFLVPSTSGLATLSMPIMAPLADFANVDRSVMVTAYQSAEGVINMVAPTVASLMGGLAIAKVSYGLYLRRTWKFFVVLSLISMAVVTVISL
ncbi:MAG TPA: hypothetical protein VF809_01115 [Candidatus Saccharimonadales bacterium]